MDIIINIFHYVADWDHPQTNGLVEKFNQTLTNMLMKMSVEKKDDWDDFIYAALFLYRYFTDVLLSIELLLYVVTICRTSRHAFSKFTPFQLLYKREPRLPVDVLLQPNSSEKNKNSCK